MIISGILAISARGKREETKIRESSFIHSTFIWTGGEGGDWVKKGAKKESIFI